MMRLATITLLLFATAANAAGPFRAGGPATIDNDASCDISHLPAATLLLPYFEVDLSSGRGTGENTIFTVTNVSSSPRIAYVTLWSSFDYPVASFYLYLTGYDVQSVNLYDLLRHGRLPATGSGVSPQGELSAADNPLVDERSCMNLPAQLPQAYITRMQTAFTAGRLPAMEGEPACNHIGWPQLNAYGYATIDVVSSCRTASPVDLSYYAGDLLFDNVLGGDYIQVNGDNDRAQASPMVHIRAIPEGGTSRARLDDSSYRVNVPRTFYARFQHPLHPTRDARQPLPSTWAARWIHGGATGFETHLKIWREGRSTSATVCSAYAANSFRENIEVVRFDEEENPEIFRPDLVILPITYVPRFGGTTLADIDSEFFFPPATNGATAGWVFLNMDDDPRDAIARQSWIVTAMHAEDRFSVESHATALGNGCSAPQPPSGNPNGIDPIGPSPNRR